MHGWDDLSADEALGEDDFSRIRQNFGRGVPDGTVVFDVSQRCAQSAVCLGSGSAGNPRQKLILKTSAVVIGRRFSLTSARL
ncbi:hypothetical protein MLPF_1608 [Mycobacterium lepromatosis]|nr:hypothetical protein MLPF_1608 [Mycobacterium lepromatosis]